MECGECNFWNVVDQYCTDESWVVNSEDGERCCRYHPDAITLDEYIERMELDTVRWRGE